MQNTEIYIVIGVIFLGCVATVGYYLVRYYFKVDEDDKDVLPSLKKSHRDLSSEDSLEDSDAEKESVSASVQQDSVSAEATPPVKNLGQVLLQTRVQLWGQIKQKFSSNGLPSEDLESLEEVLYTADLGPKTVQQLIANIEEKLSLADRSDLEKLRQALREEMLQILSRHSEAKEVGDYFSNVNEGSAPQVWMVVGVNGVGKTTTIAKLANYAANAKKKVMVVAGDTFRAAADSQLRVWGERANVEIFSLKNVKDPSAVAFDALTVAKAQNFDLIIVDTAGRLHTQDHLMSEIQKMKRVMAKVIPEAPQETLIVLDANSGQNALVQAKMFHDALSLTGVIVTKLDGSAKGGVVLGLACELDLPIRMIGVGEQLNDLRPFSSKEFVDSVM